MTRREFMSSTAAVVTGMATGMVESKEQPSGTAGSVKPLRVVQIGAQGHYGDIVTGIPTVEGCRLAAVARSFPDEQIEKLKETPAWSTETKVYDDYRRMLDEVKPDIAAVFAPYAHNGQVNIEAVRRGCHVISEKPLASTLEDLDTLRSERDRAKVRVTAMLPMRWQPGLSRKARSANRC
jgi:predicted dehydrogenase